MPAVRPRRYTANPVCVSVKSGKARFRRTQATRFAREDAINEVASLVRLAPGFEDSFQKSANFGGRFEEIAGGGAAALAYQDGDAGHVGEDGLVADVVPGVNQKRFHVAFAREQETDGGPFIHARAGKNFPDFFAAAETQAAVFGDDFRDDEFHAGSDGAAGFAIVNGESGFFDLDANAFEASEFRLELAGGTDEQAALIAIRQRDAMTPGILDGVALAADVANP